MGAGACEVAVLVAVSEMQAVAMFLLSLGVGWVTGMGLRSGVVR